MPTRALSCLTTLEARGASAMFKSSVFHAGIVDAYWLPNGDLSFRRVFPEEKIVRKRKVPTGAALIGRYSNATPISAFVEDLDHFLSSRRFAEGSE